MLYISIKTIITAVVIIAVSEIAKRSSLLAGLIVSIPLTSFLAFMWLYWETRDSQQVIELSYSIMLMVIPSFSFFIFLPLFLKLQSSFIASMIISTIATALFYWLYVELLDKFGISF